MKDTLCNKMTISELQENMLFAAIWNERKHGGFNSTDFFPFVALKKIRNQGVDSYEGVLLTEYKILVNNKSVTKVKVGNKYYKPLSSFKNSVDNRIFISNDLDEICSKFLERF